MKRYDVIIYDWKTRTVDTVAGEDMPLESGSFHTARKRLDTVLTRLNDHYTAAIVDTGRFKKGDRLPDGVEVE